jgi:hypothetical protein
MLAYGGDRVRETGGRIILHSAISKGWTPRRAKTDVHAEFPGTAVLWDDRYFEVISASLLPRGGVRYVLEPWRESHTIRVFDQYDEASEARRLGDFRAAEAQRKHSAAARFAGILFGYFPRHVQEYLENELGVSSARMTLASCLPSVILLGVCAWLYVDATLNKQPSPVPFWLWLVVFAFVLESGVRFNVAMSQSRGIGSLLGAILYIVFWLIPPVSRRWPSPFAVARGQALFTLPPPDDVALRDKLQTRSAFMTLLPREEQLRIAERYGWDYRKDAFVMAWIILVCTAAGAISSALEAIDSGSLSAVISLIPAAGLALEQIQRLIALRRGPAGSILAILVRPFLRDLL